MHTLYKRFSLSTIILIEQSTKRDRKLFINFAEMTSKKLMAIWRQSTCTMYCLQILLRDQYRVVSSFWEGANLIRGSVLLLFKYWFCRTNFVCKLLFLESKRNKLGRTKCTNTYTTIMSTSFDPDFGRQEVYYIKDGSQFSKHKRLSFSQKLIDD